MRELAREKIMALEGAIRGLPPVELKTVHHFAPGVYARELHIPAGVVLTGKIHKTEHLNIISAGRLEVYSDGEVKEICAPCTFVSKPGTKRAGFAFEDTVWTCIHVTEETDLVKIEADVIVESFELLDQQKSIGEH